MEVHITVTGSPIVEELVIASRSATQLVLGVSTNSAATAVIFDTVPRALARRSACPVTLVPGLSEEREIRQIVCGVDRSDASAAALKWAAGEASRRDVALAAIEIAVPGHGHRDHRTKTPPLSAWVGQQLPPSSPVASCVTEVGVRRPAQRLIDVAAQQQAMLAIGTSNRPAFRLASSVAGSASSQTQVPVTLVPASWQDRTSSSG
jgi:nucleotide-binding universal stress UspA family protein